MTNASGFPAVSKANARVLILGSMQGLPSLTANQYYANPHNAFWRIMGTIYDFDPGARYASRLSKLKKSRIALWDVVESCFREGSLDSAIRSDSVRVNDFNSFLQGHSQIALICFNGGKAEQLWKRHVAPGLGDTATGPVYHRLPSTSPAHAAMPYATKLKQWRKILPR